MIILGLDLETTGLLAPEHRIIECAALEYELDLDKKWVTGPAKWVQRFNPQRPIEAAATAVHGITFEAVAHEPTFKERSAKLLSIIKGADLIVAHNGRGFDLPFLKKEFAGIGTALGPVRLVDTMLEARWATPYGKVPSLEELCFATGVEYDRKLAHAAEYDTDRMIQAYLLGLQKGFFTTTGEVFE
jgi:DNA polymerase III subunit epsilon